MTQPVAQEEQRVSIDVDGEVTVVRLRCHDHDQWIDVVVGGGVLLAGTVMLVLSVVREPTASNLGFFAFFVLLGIGAVLGGVYHWWGEERWRFGPETLVLETGVWKCWRRRTFERAAVGEWWIWMSRPMPRGRRLPMDVGSNGVVVFRYRKRTIHAGYSLSGEEGSALLLELERRQLVSPRTTRRSTVERILGVFRGV